MRSSFHLSLPVQSLDASVAFFTTLLGGTVTHRDPSGYVNIDLVGVQLTLTHGSPPAIADFHFGINVGLPEFEAIAERVRSSGDANVVSEPRVVDAGTAMERRKMYLRCPSGYLVEVKGYAEG